LCPHPTPQGQVINLLQIWLWNACFVCPGRTCCNILSL
jgi:hypothetical protein